MTLLRPDAFRDHEVGNGEYPEDAAGGEILCPLPHLGPETPNQLAIRLLVKTSFLFGGYALLLRLLSVASPEIAFFLSRIIAALFATVAVTAWLAPSQGKTEWPTWIGAALLLVYANYYFLSDLNQSIWGEHQSPLSGIWQIAIGTLLLMSVLGPLFKSMSGKFSLGQAGLGILAAIEGATFGVKTYFPESPFGTWNLFVVVVFVSYCAIGLIGDQYRRFQDAIHFKDEASEWGSFAVIDRYGVRATPLSVLKLIAALWIGNYCFLVTLSHPFANGFGLLGFMGTLAVLTWLGADSDYPLREVYHVAWDAVCFWLTYNTQRAWHPNVFQCRGPFQEPLVRVALAGIPLALLAILVLHLAGIHAKEDQNRFGPEESIGWSWNCSLPQSFPDPLKNGLLPDWATAAYAKHATAIAEHGESRLSTDSQFSLTHFLASMLVAIIAAPLMLVFLVANTEGNALVRHIHHLEHGDDDE